MILVDASVWIDHPSGPNRLRLRSQHPATARIRSLRLNESGNGTPGQPGLAQMDVGRAL